MTIEMDRKTDIDQIQNKIKDLDHEVQKLRTNNLDIRNMSIHRSIDED